MDVGIRHSNVRIAASHCSGNRAQKPLHAVRVALCACATVISFLLVTPVQVAAQDGKDQRASFAVELLRDPTVYAPSVFLYTSMKLDWNSSQPFFQNGFLEENSRYTQSGFAKDKPLSYSEGNQQILKDALMVLPVSFVNSAVTQLVERKLSARYPEQRKLWKTLSWIERTAFASFASYRISSPHFRQWQLNQRLAQQYGF
jgi:hypothetical protein